MNDFEREREREREKARETLVLTEGWPKPKKVTLTHSLSVKRMAKPTLA